MVFALRPTAGSINREDFFNSDASREQLRAGNAPSGLVWYKWLYEAGDMPVRLTSNGLSVGRPWLRDPGRFVSLSLTIQDTKFGVSWTIDEFGNFEHGTRIDSELYKRARKTGNPPLPDPETFELRDDPPPLNTDD